MNKNTYLPVFILCLFSLTGCNQVRQADQALALSEAELCLQVKQLVAQHETGFKDLKGHAVVTKRMDIWQAKYHLVGNDCQIWRWSNGKQTYMCSRTMPDEKLAVDRFDRAVKFTRQCLGNEWSAETIKREKTGAVKTILSKQGKQTIASVHRIHSQGLFDSEWTIYYFIGDRDKTL